MTMLRRLLFRLVGIVRRPSHDAALSAEVQAHLDMLEDEYIATGMAPDAARLAARKAFGGVDQVKAVCHDQRGWPWFDALAQDIRFALRLLLRDRGFTLTAILVLGLGIGVNTMQFAVFDAHLLRGLPIERPHRVLFVSTFNERVADRGVSHQDFQDLRRSTTTFAGLAAYINAPVVIGDKERAPERRDASRMTANAFALLGFQPLLGRSFVAEDDHDGASPVVILSHAIWRSRYGSDPSLVGRLILVDDVPTTVVGVVADRAGFPSTAEIFLPLGQTRGLLEQSRAVRTLRVFGRLVDGATVVQARAEVESLTDRLARQHADTSTGNRARVVPINERILGRLQPAWYGFLAVGFLIAAIASANVANLMLARSLHRTREMAIRTSLGATRTRIARQLLVESSVLAALGGLVGLGVGWAGLRAFASIVPPGLLPYWMAYTMDLRGVTMMIVISALALAIFGFLPAVYASRTDVNRALKEGGGFGPARGARRWTTAFVIGELALTVVMMANLVLGLRRENPTLPSDSSVETAPVLTATVTLPPNRYPEATDRAAFLRRLDASLALLPGVTALSVASHLPRSGAVEQAIAIEGRAPDTGDAPHVWSVAIGPRYFDVLGLGVTRGRALLPEDGDGGRLNIVVNERLAELYFPGVDPVGQRVALNAVNSPNQPVQWLTVVGVAPTVRRLDAPDADPIAYVPIGTAMSTSLSLLLRSTADPMALGPLVRNAVAAIDPGLPIFRVLTMAQVVYETAWSDRVSTVLISLFSLIAVAFTGVGLYAVTAHTVGLRTREMGLRMALGATRLQVCWTVVHRTLVHLGIALVLGGLGAVWWDRAFESGNRAGLGMAAPQSLLIVAGLLLLVTLAACLVPARRATQLDPVAALRSD